MVDEQPRFESWIDRQVREAIESGRFDDLPGAGKPLHLRNVGDPDWWVKQKLADEDLSGALPPALALRKAKEDLPQTLASVRRESDARAIIEHLNATIRQANANPITQPAIYVAQVDVEAALTQWRAQRRP